MSKTKTVVENIEIDVKPIPTGNISLKEFINSEPGRLSFIQFKDENFSDIEKFIGFLCNYQACEIASALVKAGKPFAVLDEDAQKALKTALASKFIGGEKPTNVRIQLWG